MNEAEGFVRISLTNQKINDVIDNLKFVTEARITYTNTQLVKYVDLLYKRAIYNYILATFHHSPQFFATLLAIWGFIVAIYNGIVMIIDLLHLKELLQLVDILGILWPAFREKMNKVYGKISEFSAQIGWGADGLSHLVQAAQGGLNLIGGFLNKPESWLQIQGSDKVVGAMERVSDWSTMIKNDPGQLLDLVFRSQSNIIMREQKKWWNDTMTWLNKTANMATEAIQKVNDTIDNLMELHNNLPQIVRDNIPSGLLDGLTWVDNQIDDTILPALTNISKEFAEINAQLESERQRTENLVNQLAYPGDLLLGIDNLGNGEKDQQERNIDDVTSRLYEKETDKIYESDIGMIEGLESIAKLIDLVIPSPEFMTLETIKRAAIVLDPVEEKVGWFVGDF